MREVGRDSLDALAPKGRMRVAVNYGNPVLAKRDASGAPAGVSVEIARELARQAEVEIEFVTFDAAGKVFDAAAGDVWDVAFLASDPARATQILFTEAYVKIEATAIDAGASAIAGCHSHDWMRPVTAWLFQRVIRLRRPSRAPSGPKRPTGNTPMSAIDRG